MLGRLSVQLSDIHLLAIFKLPSSRGVLFSLEVLMLICSVTGRYLITATLDGYLKG